MTGKSTSILWELIGRLADTSLTVHISGENGTGKEAIARLIHRHCPHPDAQFLKCDCQHMDVRSSGAEKERQPLTSAKLHDWLVSPHHNVLYFKHIDAMPLDLQDRLQHMLEQQVQTTPPWILTSNDNPMQSHLAGSRLNKKLIDRLNTIHIHIPPLRRTPKQIPQILAWYLNHANNDPAHGLPLMPDASTMKRLMDYHWPGNLHQLRQISQRVIEQQGWHTVINSLETLNVSNAEIIDEMVAIFILSFSKINVCKERVLESLIAAADINDVGLLDLAIFHEVASHFADRISMPNRKDYPHEE